LIGGKLFITGWQFTQKTIVLQRLDYLSIHIIVLGIFFPFCKLNILLISFNNVFLNKSRFLYKGKSLVKKYIAVFIIGVVMGAILHKKRDSLPFYKDYKLAFKKFNILNSYKNNILVVKYSAGIPLFIDRSYYDQIGDRRLEGLFLIQTERHYHGVIDIWAKKPLIVYRVISKSNENNIFVGYEKTDIKVKVLGGTSQHTRVIRKKFPAGLISLEPGGPKTFSPILISIEGKAFPDLGFNVLTNKNAIR
jgi:hypothetical protein